MMCVPDVRRRRTDQCVTERTSNVHLRLLPPYYVNLNNIWIKSENRAMYSRKYIVININTIKRITHLTGILVQTPVTVNILTVHVRDIRHGC